MKPFIPTLSQAQLAINQAESSPVYLTSKLHLIHKVNLMRSAFGDRVKLFYAVKANYNTTIIQILKEAGIDGLDTVAPYEILLGKKLGFTSDQMFFTGNSCSNYELKFVQNQGVICNLGSLSELRRYGELFPNAECSIRLNVDVGAGECDFVVTGGEDTKFGISDKDLDEARNIIKKCNLKIIGIHAHIGSGFYEKDSFIAGVHGVLDRVKLFDTELDFIDFGGGFGIRYSQDQSSIDIMDWGLAIKPLLDDFASRQKESFHFRLEPGKFLVGESTCLITKVTMVKPERKTTFIGTDTGFNHLIRPALYASHHEIVNLSANSNRDIQNNLTIVGNVCESGDIFASNISLPEPREDDVLALVSAGGYGQSMSAIYQMRPPAVETMISGDDITVTRPKKSFEDLYDFIQ